MNPCPLCSGQLIHKVSSAGPEIYCNDCRNIILSSSLGFIATADQQVEECEVEGVPGFKGPGKKAKCWTYQNDQEKSAAREKAEASAHNSERMAHVSRLINKHSTSFSNTSAPAAVNPMASQTVKPPAAPESAMSAASATGMVGANGLNIDSAGSPDNGPLSTATASRRRLYALATELDADPEHPKIDSGMLEALGHPFCTAHNSYECACGYK